MKGFLVTVLVCTTYLLFSAKVIAIVFTVESMSNSTSFKLGMDVEDSSKGIRN